MSFQAQTFSEACGSEAADHYALITKNVHRGGMRNIYLEKLREVIIQMSLILKRLLQ